MTTEEKLANAMKVIEDLSSSIRLMAETLTTAGAALAVDATEADRAAALAVVLQTMAALVLGLGEMADAARGLTPKPEMAS